MWDYDKLFAEGNIVGLHNVREGETYGWTVVDKSYWHQSGQINWQDYFNSNLSFDTGFYLFEIQYIIRLDEHGNVVEKLFDRERDMKPEPEPMPELETGMFIRVYDKSEDKTILAFVYKEGKRVIYQDGDFDDIADVIKGDYTKIVEVYPASVLSFNCCYRGAEIWRSPESN